MMIDHSTNVEFGEQTYEISEISRYLTHKLTMSIVAAAMAATWLLWLDHEEARATTVWSLERWQARETKLARVHIGDLRTVILDIR